jgi:hypothetical protein
MHRDAPRIFVESSQQPHDLILATLAENMKTPCAVFAAAPGNKNASHMQLANGLVHRQLSLYYSSISRRRVPHPNVVFATLEHALSEAKDLLFIRELRSGRRRLTVSRFSYSRNESPAAYRLKQI